MMQTSTDTALWLLAFVAMAGLFLDGVINRAIWAKGGPATSLFASRCSLADQPGLYTIGMLIYGFSAWFCGYVLWFGDKPFG